MFILHDIKCRYWIYVIPLKIFSQNILTDVLLQSTELLFFTLFKNLKSCLRLRLEKQNLTSVLSKCLEWLTATVPNSGQTVRNQGKHPRLVVYSIIRFLQASNKSVFLDHSIAFIMESKTVPLSSLASLYHPEKNGLCG